MNNNVERIKQLDAQLRTLEKVMSKESYLAAGVSIDLTIGPKDDDMAPDLHVDLGITADLKHLLEVIHAGLLNTRKWRYKQAQEDYAQLTELLASNSRDWE